MYYCNIITLMQYFSEEDQEVLRRRLINIGKQKYSYETGLSVFDSTSKEKIDEYGGENIKEWVSNFNKWFTEVKNIDPLVLDEKDIQPLVDRLLNSQDGVRNFRTVLTGFYHCWFPEAQVPFLCLTQTYYCKKIPVDWCIDVDYKRNPDGYSVCKKAIFIRSG